MSSCITSAMLHGMFNDLYVRDMHVNLGKCLLLVNMDIVVICFLRTDERRIKDAWWEGPRRTVL